MLKISSLFSISAAKVFLGFVLLSGAGWLCDFLSFTIFINVFHLHEFTANFISSYIGVTFVWFTSLKMLFMNSNHLRLTFLHYYWGFQFLSILAYSYFLHTVTGMLHLVDIPQLGDNAEMAAKIIITPFNLITNFIFMKLLLRYSKREN